MIGLVGTCGQVSRSIFSNKGLGFLTVLTSVSVCFLALNKREKCESIFCVCVCENRRGEERRSNGGVNERHIFDIPPKTCVFS